MTEPEAPATLPERGADDVVYVVDISAYIFRAYHALPPLSSSRGEPTHAVRGVAQMLLKLIETRDPKRLVIAKDERGPTKRKERYPEYKANRPPAPEDLHQQIERVSEMVDAWGMCAIGMPGYEADDVIATVVREARGAGLRTVIVSADKDLLQLVGDGVVMYDTMRDKVFGPAETREKMGVPPEQVRDLLAMMGDSSDNVPGLPGVGAKTAAKYLAAYGSLDGLYENVDKLKGKAKEKVENNRDLAYLSQDLVSLVSDLTLPTAPKEASFSGETPTALRQLFGELEFSSLLGHLEAEPAAESVVRVASSLDELRAFARDVRKVGRLGLHTVLDIDDARRGHLVGIALAHSEGEALYLPMGHRYVGAPAPLDRDEVLAVLGPLLSNSLLPKVSGDKKRAVKIYARFGVPVRGVTFDAGLASYLFDPGRHDHSLPAVTRAELDIELQTRTQLVGTGKKKVTPDMREVEEVAAYAGALADHALRLAGVFAPRLTHGDFPALYRELEMPLADVLAEIEDTGIRVDAALLAGLAKEAGEELVRLEAECHALAGHDFNVGSPRQLETILFDELELPVIKKTKTARSTDQTVLEELAVMHDLPKAILAHRSLAKLKSTYLDSLPKDIDPKTGRIHTSFRQTVAATGRLSSSDPNLQNIPIRTAMGRRVRHAFVPAEGWTLMAADYSQIELRVLAHLSGDEALVDAYATGADVHKRTASALFDVDAEEVDGAQRNAAKTVNFAVIYGQTQFALARNLGITRPEAKRYIEAFFARYAGVKAYMDTLIEEAHRTGYVTTMLGRRRALNDIRSSNRNLRAAAERIARNTPIQGTAADIIKRAMLDVSAAMRSASMESKMLLTVHDELVFEAPPDEKEALEALVREKMSGAADLGQVPLEVSVGWGPHWGAAH